MIVLWVMIGCENSLEMMLPRGPQGEKGEKGEKGDAGKSAFELWLEYYKKDAGTSIQEFFNSLKGKDGKDGKDGDVPIIGANGNWWISGVDTEIPAQGKKGKDGVSPLIGTNGNWSIDGVDTGVPARGKDGFSPYIQDGYWWINDINTLVPATGKEGKAGRAITVKIGPKPNYYWILNEITTNISAKGIDGRDGKDGKNGYSPVIGDNGNWWIDGKDTGRSSTVIPVIGQNGNWWIGGVDTGKASQGDRGDKGDRGEKGDKGDRGDNGVNGKSAYELWKEAVDKCDGTIKNKDGSNYDCLKNSWEDFLNWLQGGDVSVLHKYWTTLPGNVGKTIQQFIDELFDCHCDGISVNVIAPDDCVELKADGTLEKNYNAKLSITGKRGTSVQVTGAGVNRTGNITDDQTPLTLDIPRGDANIQLTIVCTTAGDAVTKNALIPALKYIKLDGQATVTQVSNEQKDVSVLKFLTEVEEMIVDGAPVYTRTKGVVGGSGWQVTDGGKTFTKTYDRAATLQEHAVIAKGGNGECSTIASAFAIPTLTPVTAGTPSLTVLNNCELTIAMTGSSGMKVNAAYGNTTVTTVTLTESAAGGTYTATVPRAYSAYTITLTAEKGGAGTVTKTVSVTGGNLITVQNPLQLSLVAGNSDNVASATLTRELKNNTTAPLKVTVVRSNNTASRSLRRTPPVFPYVTTIPAGSTTVMTFQRDYTSAYAGGSYTLTLTAENECGLTKATTLAVPNQTNYTFKFNRPAGYGGAGQPGGPGWIYTTDGDPNITFNVELYDAIPNSYVEFQLFKGVGYSAILRIQSNAAGRINQAVTMKASELELAIKNGFGFFKFFSDQGYTTPYNIGVAKEKVPFSF